MRTQATQRLLDKRCSTQLRARFARRCRLRRAARPAAGLPWHGARSPAIREELRCPAPRHRVRRHDRPGTGRPPGAAEGVPAHRRAQDGHDLPAAGDVGQPGQAGGAGRRAARPPRAGPLPGQPGPARPGDAAADPAGSWAGEWEILAGQAKRAPKAAVISHELFSAADAGQAERAVRSLQPADVHLILTVRDMATLLPAEWQESVKHRSARSWEDWLGDVIDRESRDPGRRRWWFWCVHDTLAILDTWSRHVPAERVHVITTPPRGSAAACCGNGSRPCSASTPRGPTFPWPGRTPRSACPRWSSCAG